MEGVVDVHYASLTSQGVQHRVFYLDGHPSRYQPRPTGLNFGEQTGTGVLVIAVDKESFFIIAITDVIAIVIINVILSSSSSPTHVIECVHMTSWRPCWRSEQRNGGHVGGVKYSFGHWTLFLCKFLLCFIMQIWLLVTWANTLYTYVPLFYDIYQVPDSHKVNRHTQSVAKQNNVQHNIW